MDETKSALEVATEAAVPNSDYESDDEGTSALAMRRREASDDEQEEEEEEEEEGEEIEFKYYIEEQFESEEEAGKNKEAPAEEKKESEPFLVPTAGAFYMHDDRFRDNGGARPRRGLGTRRLWEAKDEKPWTHDMFNDEDENDEGMRRRGRGQVRGRGRARGRGRGRGRNGNTERVPRVNGRGRGGRREADEGEMAFTTNRDGTSKFEKEFGESYVAKKQVGASSLSSSSPPFFPTGALSSNATTARDNNQDNRKTGQGGKKLTATSSVFVPKLSQGKAPVAESSSRGQASYGSNSFFSAPLPTKQGPREYVKLRPPARPKQAQPSSRVVQPAEVQETSTGSSRTSSTNPGSGVAFRPRNANDGGRGGRGGKNFSHGETARDSSVPSAAQAVRPLVPFANQSQGAMVVPSMGMAMPVSGQPMYGYGNSEITWVPFLSGGGTSVGAGFMSPYVPVDGAYYQQPGAHTLVNSIGDLASTSTNVWRPPSETSALSDGRQNKQHESSLPKAESAY